MVDKEIEQGVTPPVAQQPQPVPPPVAQQPQPVPPPAAQQPQQQQQTRSGRFFRCLFTCIFYTQLTLISIFVILLTLRGLVCTKSPNFHPKKWYTPLLSSVAVSGILSVAWNCFFVCNKRATVKATFWFSPLLTISVGLFLILYDKTNPVVLLIGALLVVYSIVTECYGGLYVRNKYEFTFKMMSIATGMLPARTRAIAIVSVIISVFYSGFLVVGIGGATATRTRLDILFISILVISLAWTMQVLKNVQEVAISKATYVYFRRDEVMNACTALGVTLKKQLGSVCIASTLVPLIVLFRGTTRCCNLTGRCDDDQEMYESTRGCNWIANHIILGGNRYGFVHVGAYNKGFKKASSDTWRRFRTVAGFEQLIDFDIPSSICFSSAMGIGAVSALTAGIWELLIDRDHYFELTIYAFIIGYFVGRVSSAWLQACVMGYYVAYSEDPQNDRFDDTIPQRIVRQNIEKAQREGENRVREDEDEEITHVSHVL
ncbi:Choline transporter-like [Arabidopsis suecica]|uniref:Choline transporter-like protein n=1 Tax=Arabidopsis suecica TaxID=45249 RepID=A0A8T1Z9Q9_ARASU|nr:Choline transporter-like [Arabidopsis suecica]